MLMILLVDFHTHFWLRLSEREHLKFSSAKKGTSTENFGRLKPLCLPALESLIEGVLRHITALFELSFNFNWCVCVEFASWQHFHYFNKNSKYIVLQSFKKGMRFLGWPVWILWTVFFGRKNHLTILLVDITKLE